MKTRQFGNTALYITPITFGAWEIGGEPFYSNLPDDDSIALIHEAFVLGINFFDTAPIYGFGHSERILGKAVKKFRDKIVISTKCGLRWKENLLSGIYKDSSKKSILDEIDETRKRLDTDVIDLYLVHWPDVNTPIGQTIETLETIKAQGKIRYYGLSNFSTAQIAEAARYGSVSALQSQYSMLNLKLENSELPYCIENNIGFQAYSPLHRGVLTDKTVESLREFAQPAINWILDSMTAENTRQVLDIKEIMNYGGYGCSFASFVTAWTIAQPGITTAIIGTTKPQHIKDVAGAAEITISAEDARTIRSILENNRQA
ncbi:aldo/keto reductase [Candidatus Magnetominusculus xianensis]|uniref:Aldo/keto reductase n=1 Tax=Candidatus Magnetominusculus xianensis TaxID=1748249 RepID=A0ABR5SHU5_9BACT|nr:aldo/keto reductase [Candidatus Magnetominusculus xianensis]KWT91810.1 aldo/keto reductase [Candidatus Magnetominusculus xianensis]MBF0403866.1 aldo/keto reductase [Nitrospirota bacterium]